MTAATVGLAVAWTVWNAIRMERLYRRQRREIERSEARGRAIDAMLEASEREWAGLQARSAFRRRDWGQA